MNIVKASIIAAASILVSTSVNAAETFSLAYVPQLNSSSISSMSMKDIVEPMMQVAQAMPAVAPSQGNLGLIWQDGEFNNASISQMGSGNVGLVRQIGLTNTAAILQSGIGHQALIYQQGRGNVAVIQQR